MDTKANKLMLMSLITASFIAATGYSVGMNGGKGLVEGQYDEAFKIASEEQAKNNKSKDTFLDTVLKDEPKKAEKKSEDKKKSNSTSKSKKNSTSKSKNRNTSSPGASSSSVPAVGNVSVPNKLKDGVYFGSASGYSGPVRVKVTVQGGKLSNVEVVSHTETPGYYEKGASIINKIVSAGTPNVDTVSGATLTSGAIKKAVAQALKSAGDTSSSSTSGSASEDSAELERLQAENKKIKEELEKAKSNVNEKIGDLKIENLKDGTYEGEGTGFEGRKTKVSVTVEGGKIKSVNVVSFGDDEPYFTNAKSIIGKIIDSQSLKVDVVSGATYSSNGIKYAIIDALKKAGLQVDSSAQIDELKKSIDTLAEKNKELSDNILSMEAEYKKLKSQLNQNRGETKLSNGTFEGDGYGFMRRPMKVSVVVENEKIKSVNVTSTTDDEPYISSAKELIDRLIGKSSTDGVDAVSGATFSSNGIKDAVEDALSKARVSVGNSNKPEEKPSDTEVTESTEISIDDESVLEGKSKEEKISIANKNIENIDKNIQAKEGDIGPIESAIMKLEEQLRVLREKLSSVRDRINYFRDLDTKWHKILEDLNNSSDPDTNSGEGGENNTENPKEEPKQGPPVYRDGKYIGNAKGFEDRDMSLEITISNNMITDIKEIVVNEDKPFFKSAKRTLYPKIKKSTDIDSIDVVSGATYTSNGIKNAVKDALQKALEK